MQLEMMKTTRMLASEAETLGRFGELVLSVTKMALPEESKQRSIDL
jgi:hypothetical protein